MQDPLGKTFGLSRWQVSSPRRQLDAGIGPRKPQPVRTDMTNHTMPTPQDATKMRLNLNMLYDPATALARGEPLFIQDIKTSADENPVQDPNPSDQELELSTAERLGDMSSHVYTLHNLAHALDQLVFDAPGSSVGYRAALVGVSDAIMQEIEAAMKLAT
jgi:hypothetical protein